MEQNILQSHHFENKHNLELTVIQFYLFHAPKPSELA